ncbi:hypothetical protein cypCar_00045480 [Cyprinus carpio]|nr:hypothetical protein cypCar_00045480 [Cyprinus carpio]
MPGAELLSDVGESLLARQPYLFHPSASEAYPFDVCAPIGRRREPPGQTTVTFPCFSVTKLVYPICKPSDAATIKPPIGHRREPHGHTKPPFPSYGRRGLPVLCLSNSKAVSQKNRGRELPGFSNYKVFETVLQKHVAKLNKPANDLLRGMKGQQEKAEQRISEQFKMENLIYTQDPIFLKILSEIGNEQFSKKQLPMFDKKCKYSHMLEAHYEIVVQRMADQLPMMITLFMLKETAEVLSTDILGLLDGANIVVQRMADQLPMMISLFMLKETAEFLSTDILGLLDGANVSELLFEDSDVSKRRKDLRVRLDRLSAAQAALTEFI